MRRNGAMRQCYDRERLWTNFSLHSRNRQIVEKYDFRSRKSSDGHQLDYSKSSLTTITFFNYLLVIKLSS